MAFIERYVRADAAGGGNGTTDTNSGVNGAWTLTEAAANVGTGIRYNVKSGTYTLGANLTLGNGAGESPNAWQGFQTTIGDLENIGRATATGQLTTTNFPLLAGGSFRVISGSHNILRNLRFTSTVTGGQGTVTTGANASIVQCSLENTNPSGVGVCVNCNFNHSAVVDSDLVFSSTSGSANAIDLSRGSLVGCLVLHTGSPASGTTGVLMSSLGSACIGNVIRNFGVAIKTGASSGTVAFNSVHSVVDGVWLGNNTALIYGNVFNSVTGYLIKGVADSGNPIIICNASTVPTSGRIDTATVGTVIEEIDPIVLSGDPFTNSGAGDFTLNNTSGAGALCRAASLFFGGFSDLGAVQVEPAAGGGGGWGFRRRPRVTGA